MKRCRLRDSLHFFLGSALSAFACALAADPADVDDISQWSWYGGDPGGTRYADIGQIDRDNVADLEVAWKYRTGELGEDFMRRDKLAFEATPIFVEGSLYLSTPTDIVIALDPVTGKEHWRYNPHIARNVGYSEATS